MAFVMSPQQKRAVESIMSKVLMFLDFRYSQVRRINPKVESVWEDLAWQQMTKLRNTLSADKSFGPVRFHVAEALLSDDAKRVREFFSAKSQASLQAEVVEEKETEGHRTHGALEIHDMRTLCKAIDPALESTAMLMQAYIWWDLEDAVDLARFEKKVSFIAGLEKHGLSDEMAEFYREQIDKDKKPTQADVLNHELKGLRRTVENFRLRRGEEKGFQVLVAREAAAVENPEIIIDALAGQQGLLRNLRNGAAIDDNLRAQLARALNVEPAGVTVERTIAFLDQTIGANRKRLKAALSGVGAGEPYNVKLRQMEELDRKFQEVIGDRKPEEFA